MEKSHLKFLTKKLMEKLILRHVAGIVVLLHLFVDHMRNLGGAGDGGT